MLVALCQHLWHSVSVERRLGLYFCGLAMSQAALGAALAAAVALLCVAVAPWLSRWLAHEAVCNRGCTGPMKLVRLLLRLYYSMQLHTCHGIAHQLLMPRSGGCSTAATVAAADVSLCGCSCLWLPLRLQLCCDSSCNVDTAEHTRR
jgi:hypothetical protein